MYAHEERGSSPELSTAAAADVGPSPKKSSRRSAQKRVVSLPAPETEGPRLKPGSEAAPPPDSWAWRKYGQKPIKGSPYPRGYYRCSSSKGCPARKQVERSRTDPTMFVVTYSSDHNHSWPPIPRNHHHQTPPAAAAAARKAAAELTPAETSPTEPVSDPEEKFSDLIVEEPSLLMPDDFRWPPHSSSAAEDDGLLYGPLFGGAPLCDDGLAVDEEEDALFAGLGELPECSVIFRRAVLDRQMRRGEEGKRFGLEVEEVAVAAAGGAAAWCGSTG